MWCPTLRVYHGFVASHVVGRVGVEAEKELRQKGAGGVKLHSRLCREAYQIHTTDACSRAGSPTT
jgi:hypothetical protein